MVLLPQPPLAQMLRKKLLKSLLKTEEAICLYEAFSRVWTGKVGGSLVTGASRANVALSRVGLASR